MESKSTPFFIASGLVVLWAGVAYTLWSGGTPTITPLSGGGAEAFHTLLPHVVGGFEPVAPYQEDCSQQQVPPDLNILQQEALRSVVGVMPASLNPQGCGWVSSGTYLGNKLILTVRHVAEGVDGVNQQAAQSRPADPNYPVRVRFHDGSTQLASYYCVSTSKEWGWDLTILQLQDYPPPDVKPVRLAPEGANPLKQVIVAGYPDMGGPPLFKAMPADYVPPLSDTIPTGENGTPSSTKGMRYMLTQEALTGGFSGGAVLGAVEGSEANLYLLGAISLGGEAQKLAQMGVPLGGYAVESERVRQFLQLSTDQKNCRS